MAVSPGDLILGDSDGVIALSPSVLPDLLVLVRAHLAKEARMRDAYSRNAADHEPFRAILRSKGVPI